MKICITILPQIKRWISTNWKCIISTFHISTYLQSYFHISTIYYFHNILFDARFPQLYPIRAFIFMLFYRKSSTIQENLPRSRIAGSRFIPTLRDRRWPWPGSCRGCGRELRLGWAGLWRNPEACDCEVPGKRGPGKTVSSGRYITYHSGWKELALASPIL